MPNTRVNQSSTSAMLRRIRNPVVFISDNKYKMSAAQILLTMSQLIRMKFFNTTNLFDLSSVNEANATMSRILVSLTFILTMLSSLNISARLDDAALSDEKFARRKLENEILSEELSTTFYTRRYSHQPSFDWFQIAGNEFKILTMATLLLMEYMMINSLDTKTNIANVKLYYFILRILTSISIAVADRFDETSLTAFAYSQRHVENTRGSLVVSNFFDKVLLKITDPFNDAENEELEGQDIIAMRPAHP